jgi:hypothetical protein
LNEFFAHERAVQAEHTARREQRFSSLISSVIKENVTLRDFLRDEIARNDEIEVRAGKAEIANAKLSAEISNLKRLNEDLTNRLKKEELLRRDSDLRCRNVDDAISKAEKGRLEAEKKYRLAHQSTTLHSKALEQVKKESEEMEKKLRKELEGCKTEREELASIFMLMSDVSNKFQLPSKDNDAGSS